MKFLDLLIFYGLFYLIQSGSPTKVTKVYEPTKELKQTTVLPVDPTEAVSELLSKLD